VCFVVAGNTGSVFTIDPTTGVLTTTAMLDYEVAASYSLEVQAVDRGGAAGALSAFALVTVTVSNVNEFDPAFSTGAYSASVAEDDPIGTSVSQVC
jgi:hypothetical protein